MMVVHKKRESMYIKECVIIHEWDSLFLLPLQNNMIPQFQILWKNNF
jgi:hypothetical protein